MSEEDRASKEVAQSRLSLWKESISKLFNRIESDFADLVNDRLASFRRQRIYVTEELSGRYETEKLIMSLGGRNVIFQPLGLWIIGAAGRIDLFREGQQSKSYMLLRQGDTDVWMLAERSNEQWTRAAPGSRPVYDLGPVSRQSLEKAIETLL